MRHLRDVQAAVACGSSRAATLMRTLNRLVICNGLAAPSDKPRPAERLQSDGVMWADRAAEAAVRRRHLGRVAWPVRAALAGPHMRLSAERVVMFAMCL